jgi:formylglycine-generating enzyme required for sulfatase activity
MAELAARWQVRGRPSSMLLRDDDLVAARAWATKRKQEAPEITEAQKAFLNASIAESQVTRRRQLLVQAGFGALALVIVAGVAAYWNEQSVRGFYFWFAHVRSSVLTNQQEGMLKPGETFSECVKTGGDYSKYCPEMVVIPAGKFMMGSPSTDRNRDQDEGPQHEVTIARLFAVSKFEVTFNQWDACIQYGGCTRVGAPFGGGQQPAINISWDDAKDYVNWLSWLTGEPYRLLTEAEWEYAARAGSTGLDYSVVLGKYAWYSENSGGKTHFVGEKKPNAFGLYDMYGNAFEWVEDCYHDSYDGSPSDGTAWTEGDCSRRVARGGSWTNDPRSLRSTYRLRPAPDVRDNYLGFRVGRTLTP